VRHPAFLASSHHALKGLLMPPLKAKFFRLFQSPLVFRIISDVTPEAAEVD
jgi:hypothetical protein